MNRRLPDEDELLDEQGDDMEFEQALYENFEHLRDVHVPPVSLLRRLEDIPVDVPTPSSRSSFVWFRWLSYGLLPALLVLTVWVGRKVIPEKRSHLVLKGPVIRIHLEYARKHPAGLRRQVAAPNQSLYSGDLLQFVYQLKKGRASSLRHLMIIGLHPSGEFEVLAPFQKKTSLRLMRQNGTFPEGESLVVDSQSGQMVFWGLLSAHPFQTGQVKTAIQNALTSGRKIHNITQLKGPWELVWRQRVIKHTAPTP